MSRSSRRWLVVVLGAGLGVACGSKPMQPPEVIEREVPGIAEAPAPDAAVWAPPNPRQDSGPDVVRAQCCPVRFAVAAIADDVSGVIVGSEAPLAPPVAMTRDGGVWETTVCMPLVDATYHFVLGLPAVGTEDLFPVDTVNPNSPQVPSSRYGTVNEFLGASAADCASLDAGSYGDTSSDAGTGP